MSTTETTTRIEFADPQGYLLEEIANPAMKRLDVAKTYRLVVNSAWPGPGELDGGQHGHHRTLVCVGA